MLAAALALVVGGGLGLFFVLAGGDSGPAVPKGGESAILEQAKREGVISGYRALPGRYGTWKWIVDGGEIELSFPNACGDRSCPDSDLMIAIDFRHTAEMQAQQILRITRRWAQSEIGWEEVDGRRMGPAYKIIFGPPYYP